MKFPRPTSSGEYEKSVSNMRIVNNLLINSMGKK